VKMTKIHAMSTKSQDENGDHGKIQIRLEHWTPLRGNNKIFHIHASLKDERLYIHYVPFLNPFIIFWSMLNRSCSYETKIPSTFRHRHFWGVCFAIRYKDQWNAGIGSSNA